MANPHIYRIEQHPFWAYCRCSVNIGCTNESSGREVSDGMPLTHSIFLTIDSDNLWVMVPNVQKARWRENWYMPWQKSKFHMKTTVWEDGPETRPSAERQMSLIWFLKDLQFWHNRKLRCALLARSGCQNTAVATLCCTGEWRREGPNAHCPSNHSFVYWVLTLCWS